VPRDLFAQVAIAAEKMEPTGPDDKLSVTPLAKLRAPLGGQEIELQQVDYRHGGLSLLRIRIREGRRFTVFDIDDQTASSWGQAMLGWCHRQSGGDGAT